jgi:hypothetical protein
MAHQFSKHYTLEQAQSMLPQVRQWLEQLEDARDRLLKYDKRLTSLMKPGLDTGGDLVNNWAKTMADFRDALEEFQRREIQVKDIDRGLLDFPAIIGGKEVFLCWEKDEDSIEFWHDLETGYGGRERL